MEILGVVAMKGLKDNGAKNITAIAIHQSIKDKLDKNRAPGQCYNGFICQLVDLWEHIGEEKTFSRAGSANK